MLLELNSLSSFFSWLIAKDKQLFLAINQRHTNSFFDWLMPIWRNSNTWIPLYVLMLIFVISKLKKQVWIWILAASVTFLLSDQISSHILKPFFARPRPCNDVDFAPQVRLLLHHCGSGFSFTSSHACNHFGIAIFFITTLSSYLKNWKYLFIAWAVIVCYAQVYVGVHYPLDVLCGAVLGALIGKFTSNFYNKKSQTINNKQ